MTELTKDTFLVRLLDDDDDYRASQKLFLTALGWQVRDWGSAELFLSEERFETPGCLILDMRMPGLTGLEVQQRIGDAASRVPIIFLTGHGDVESAVYTLQNGAVDFLEKSADPMRLSASVTKACTVSAKAFLLYEKSRRLLSLYETLTPREKEVLQLASLGLANKEIAEKLSIGTETVKMHRANAFAKIRVQSALEAYQWLEQLHGKGGTP